MIEDNSSSEKQLIDMQNKFEEALVRLETAEREKEIYKDISQASSLDELLESFARQITKIPGVDGYFVLFADAERRSLSFKHVMLPPKWREIEKTFRQLKYSLLMDVKDPNVLAYKTNEAVVVNVAAENSEDQFELEGYQRWEIKSLASIPISYQADDVLGTVLVYSQNGAIDQKIIHQVNVCLDLFNKQLCKSIQINDLLQKEINLQRALDNQKDLLKFISRSNGIEDLDQLLGSFQKELLERYDFDISSVFLLEDNSLKESKTSIVDPKLLDKQRSLVEYYKKVKYELDPYDGATPTAFLQRIHMYIYDVMKIIDLPMSEKDKEGLKQLDTPRSFLFVPIFNNSDAIGMLWLISLNETVDLADEDISMLKLVCRFFGAYIANINA